MREQTHSQQQETSLLTIGALLKLRYHVVRLLGGGGFGQVYLARDLHWGLDVAIKVSDRSLSCEGQLLSELDHPAIPRVYRRWKQGGLSFLVMDYIEGETLWHLLDALAADNRWLSVRAILLIGIALCEVLGYLHGQPDPVIYCDLKPLNVMITPELAVRLVDFGCARSLSHLPPVVPDRLPCSMGFAAPEYCAGLVTPQADIFSLGAVLYQLLTGDDPAELGPRGFKRMWSPFGRVVMRMLAAEPARRSSVPDLERQLAGHLQLWGLERSPLAQRCSRLLLSIDRGEFRLRP